MTKGLVGNEYKEVGLMSNSSGMLYRIKTEYKVNNTLQETVETYSFDAWGNRRQASDWTIKDVSETRLFTRGFTGHEHLDAFETINMNGRLYDPTIARFLSPDPYVASNTFTQDYNRYSYCRNNPLLYTDPSGEFLWLIPNIGWSQNGGFSIGLTFMIGIPGTMSAQASIGYNFQSNDFNTSVGGTVAFNTVYVNYSTQSGLSTGWSLGLSPQMGFPISTNFTSLGVNYSISNNSWSGNISAWGVDKTGWTFNPSVSVMIYPEHTTNLVRGQGFRSNNQVFNRMMQGDYACQEILDYFGFEGTYDPGNKLFKKYGNDPAITDPTTGEIYYHDFPFEGHFDRLHFIADHERKHRANVLSGKYAGKKITEVMLASEEVDAYFHNKYNYGLYIKSKDDYDIKEMLTNRINKFNGESLKIDVNSILMGDHCRWYDFIFKIPRLW